MEKKALFWGMAVALLFSACQPKNQPEVIADGTLKGTIEQPVVEGFGAQTRAGFGESFAFNWQTGDKIMVLTSAGRKAFTLSSGAGTATGTFVGSLSSGETVSNKVASPYNSNHTLSATSTSMTLPAVYNYGNNTTFTTIPVMLPCWAPIEANAFSMSHLVGYMAFEISNIPAGANKFVLTTEDKRINGAFTADLTAGTPIFAAVDAANDTEKTVTINFTPSAEVTTHCFVVPIPVGTYTYDWYIKADETLKGFGMGEDVAVGRGQIKGCRVACVEIGGGEPEPEPEVDPYNGHAYVDLGLPSGLKWATMNVGATAPEGYGDYFAWGETRGYTDDTSDGRYFIWASYKWMEEGRNSWEYVNKYTVADGQMTASWYQNGNFCGDGKTVLEPDDDAAHVNWGGNWRMPTNEEMEELVQYCPSGWTDRNGVWGQLFVSRSNGSTLFFPVAGYRNDLSLSYRGSVGIYWSSSVRKGINGWSHCAYRLHVDDDDATVGFVSNRYYGYSIRAVCQ